MGKQNKGIMKKIFKSESELKHLHGHYKSNNLVKNCKDSYIMRHLKIKTATWKKRFHTYLSEIVAR